MRALLDTNILISALFSRGAPHECLLSAEAGLYELILADEIFNELRDKLVDKFRNSDEEVDQIVRNIQDCTETVQLKGLSGWVPDDPDDDKFIETANRDRGVTHCVVEGATPITTVRHVSGSTKSQSKNRRRRESGRW